MPFVTQEESGRVGPMNDRPFMQEPSEISYELYKELVDELLTPIEHSLDLNVRYELYLSKIVYLENLQSQCFRSLNKSRQNRKNQFSGEDLEIIRDAISSTHSFMRETILEALELRLSKIGFQRQSV
ncbi:MAG: hypothetical protein RLZZ488_1536 [Pseudomonadota bacterium]|jgi:hypothetical protein